MSDPWNPGEKFSKEQIANFIKLGTYAGIGFLAFLFILIGSCTAHSNTFDAERTHARAALESARAESERASNEARIEETQAIERLINNGTDPVAARCAIKGWGTDELLCLATKD